MLCVAGWGEVRLSPEFNSSQVSIYYCSCSAQSTIFLPCEVREIDMLLGLTLHLKVLNRNKNRTHRIVTS